MLKLIGAILTIGAFSAIGAHCSMLLKKRCETISDIISAFEVIKSEISFNLTSLCEIMLLCSRVCKNQARRFFESIYHEMISGDNAADFCGLWQSSINLLETLDPDDKKILSDTAAFLGKYDAEQQLNALNYSVRRLNSRLREAEKNLAQKSRLYRALGTGIGVIAVLLVL